MTSVFPLVLLLSSIGSSIARGHGYGHGHGGEEREHYMVVEASYLEPKAICSGLKGAYAYMWLDELNVSILINSPPDFAMF